MSSTSTLPSENLFGWGYRSGARTQRRASTTKPRVFGSGPVGPLQSSRDLLRRAARYQFFVFQPHAGWRGLQLGKELFDGVFAAVCCREVTRLKQALST